jgi:hypothetical protein
VLCSPLVVARSSCVVWLYAVRACTRCVVQQSRIQKLAVQFTQAQPEGPEKKKNKKNKRTEQTRRTTGDGEEIDRLIRSA